MLYMPERHCPWQPRTWDPSEVRRVISQLLHLTRQGRDLASGLWPIHPNDKYPGAPEYLTSFYFGALGVVWAQNELAEFDESVTKADLLVQTQSILESHRKMNRSESGDERGSYFIGLAGILFLMAILTGDVSQELLDLIHTQMNSKARELLYGSPGSLLMAGLLFERIGDESYLELAQTVSERLMQDREVDDASGARIWSQELGKKKKFIGAAHGTIGNYAYLLKALHHQSKPELRNEIIREVEKILSYYGKVEKDLCNWPRAIEADEYGQKMLVHWCHGATGIVTELSGEIAREESLIIDDLLVKGAELVWKAGPLEKGTTLCHGTSGSGMAMLKMYRRTGNEMWLDRARAFAMYAIDQFHAELKEYGRPRFSLWTGDLGFAVFLRDVLRADANMPGIDFI
jgi:lantibiotic modifying enzyme